MRRIATAARAVVAAAVLAFGLWLRTRNTGAIFVEGEVIPFDSDCASHMRRALLTLESFPRVPSFDPWVAWPDGARPTNGPGIDLLFAAVAFVFGARGDPDRAARVMAWTPVALGLLCALAAAFAAARLEPTPPRRPPTALAALAFAVASPVAVRVSSVGFTDHHVFESLAPLAALAWVAARGAAPAWRWEAQGGGLIAATTLLYPGTVMSHALLAASLALVILFEDAPRRDLVGTGAPAFGLGALLLGAASAPWTGSHRQWFHHLQLSLMQPALILGAAAALALVALAARRVPFGAPAGRAARRSGLAALALALALAPLLALAPALRREVAAGLLGWLFTRDPWMASIAECRPLFYGDLSARDALEAVVSRYGMLAAAAPLVVAAAVRRASRRDLASALAVGVTLSGYIALTLLQRRFGRALAGPLAAASALALAELVDRLANGRSEALRGWATAALASLVVASDPGVREAVATPPPAPLDGLHEAAIALRRPGVAVRPGARAGVFTSWDCGSDALLLGRRPVVVTAFGPYLGRAVFDASERAWHGSEADLVAWLDRRDAGDVLIWGRHVLALNGEGPPPARRVTPDGRAVLNTAYLRRFPIAQTMLAGSGSSRHELPHLAHLRPRFASRQFVGAFAAPLPWAWVFERVRGATLQGEARDGALVRATLPLSIRGQARLWEGWTRASGGRWALTVPIPTSFSEGFVSSGAAYSVLVDDREVAREPVSLDDVRAGRTFEVPVGDARGR